MPLFLLFGVLTGLGLRQLGIGAPVFWLLIAVHALYASLLLISRFQARVPERDEPSAGGHLIEYVWLSLAFDSGMVPAFWIALPWRGENIAPIAVAGLLLAAALLLARRAMAGR